MNTTNLKFGCPKAPEDPRDHLYKASSTVLASVANIDLRGQCPPVRNQGGLGACTAFGATSLVDFVRRKQGLATWLPSPLFTYYSTRLMEGAENSDNGAYVRDALKSTVNDGVAMERDWPYIVGKFNVRPSDEVWTNATKHQALEYLTINDYDKNAMLSCLNDGYPFVFGIQIYSSFTSSFDVVFGGNVHEPDRVNEKLLGGHCMMCVGYQKRDDGSEYMIVMNSWGTGWGDRGFCYIPMKYFLSNDSYDFWTIRLMEACNEDTPDPDPTIPVIVVPPNPPEPPEPPPVVVPPDPPVVDPVDPVVPVPPAPTPVVPLPVVDSVVPLDQAKEQKLARIKTIIVTCVFVLILILFFLIK